MYVCSFCSPVLGFYQLTSEGKRTHDCSSALQRLSRQRERGEGDGAAGLLTVLAEMDGVVQARGIGAGRVVEVDGSGDQSALAVRFPGAELAGKEKGRPSLAGIDDGQGAIRMQRSIFFFF